MVRGSHSVADLTEAQAHRLKRMLQEEPNTSSYMIAQRLGCCEKAVIAYIGNSSLNVACDNTEPVDSDTILNDRGVSMPAISAVNLNLVYKEK